MSGFPNRFFARVFNAIEGTFAQAAPVRNEFESVEHACKLIADEIDAIRPSWLPAELGAALTILRVNADATAIEFVSPGRIPLVDVAASRALLASDAGKALRCTSAGAMTLTVPANATTVIEPETAIVVYQYGAGKVTMSPEAGVTLRAADGYMATRAQYSQITLLKIAADEWIIGGDRA